VAVANDAHITALSEKSYGSAHGMKDFVVVSISHGGLGSCFFSNGQPHLGFNGFAGELGHTCVEVDGRQCGCGNKGCLEAYCSATGVARSARDLLETTDRPSLLREMKAEEITSLDVAIAAGKGDELAKEVFDFTGKMLGEACADFAAFSSPEAFVFFGGLTKAGELIMKPIEEAYNRQVLPIFKGKAKLLVSTLDGAGAAVLGASALGWEA
jgi:glucokinase